MSKIVETPECLNELVKRLAERFFNSVYKNKWRGSTMRNIVIVSFCAGYKKGTEAP